MSFATIFGLLAVATSAEGNLVPWQKTPALAPLVKQIADINGRRLQSKWGSPECTEKCPKAADLLMEMASLGQAGDDMNKIMEIMCPYADTVTCMETNVAVCTAAGEEQTMAGMTVFPCLCTLKTACPASWEPLISGEEMTDPPSPAQCAAMTCLLGEPKCEPTLEAIPAEDKAKADKCDGAAGSESSGAVIHKDALVTMAMSLTASFMW